MVMKLNIGVLSVALVMGIAFSGCVSSRTHEQTLAELEKARHAAAQQAAEDEASLAEARRENGRLAARLEEIGKDKLSTKQLRDRLTITMVDRVLFESGSDRITAEGMEVLYKVSAVLKDARDKRILVSGHTDDIRIGPSLRARFKTNWELSTARATSVVRYLVDHGGIAPRSLTVAGHAYPSPSQRTSQRKDALKIDESRSCSTPRPWRMWWRKLAGKE